MKMLSALVGFCILATALAQRPAYICEVMFDNFCPNNAATCATDPAFVFGGNSYGFSHYNLVSFGNLYVPSGDVEGRMAIRNNANMKSFSVGYQLRTKGVAANDISMPYTAIIGHDASWSGGSTHPDGSGIPYAGDKEYIFVGGSLTPGSASTDQQLVADTTGKCPAGSPGCLDATFDYAQGYYNDLSNAFSSLADNTVYNVQYGTIDLTCNNKADAQYVMTITPALFSTITYWNPINCNSKSGLIVNIVGTGNQVKFAGSTQTFFANAKTLYNVVPNGAGTPSVRVEVGTNGNLLAPSSNYNQPGLGVFIGQVIVANVQEMLQINLVYCAPPAPQPSNNNSNSNNLCPAFELQCAGLDLVLNQQTYSFRDFNAISFGNFNADTGDVQGRLAVQNNAHFGCGYSVGDQLQTATGQPDRHLPYSLIVGRDLSWCSGALYPQGDGNPYPGMKEDMYVGGNFATNETDLNDRRTGGPCASTGCLDNTFNAAKTCYTTYSNNIAAKADNVAKSIAFSGLSVTCNDASATDYYISLTNSEFAQFTYTTVGNCNFQARWYINIRGTDNVDISGASWPAVPGGVVYNVIGCGRTVTVHDTALSGSFLAPCSTLNQPNGVITGKVVAGDVTASKQINKQNTCPQSVTVKVPVVTQVPSIESTYGQFTNDFLDMGDNVDGHIVIGIQEDNIYQFNTKANWVAHQVIYVQTDSTDSRTPTPITKPDQPSDSASAVSMAFAFVAALIALAF